MATDLTKSSIFRGLTQAQVDAILALGSARKYRKGDRIFSEDSLGEELHILTKGRVDVLMKLMSDEQRLATHAPGDSFGEFAAMDCSRRSASCLAATDVEVIAIPGKAFYEHLESAPETGYVVMRNLCLVLTERLKNANLQWRNAIYWG
ncbi:MAG: cyclic nucleotide-binding domain-containing protein [Acidobacteriota bacterium]